MEPLSESLSKTRASSPTSSYGDVESKSFLNTHNESTIDVSVPSVPDTPPTPHSHIPSPILPGSTVPVIDPLLLAVRREQSDRASSAIGQYLLRGWTLLGDECQNSECYAVPLMKRPKVTRNIKTEEGASSTASSTAKLADPRRHCVICKRDYLREADVNAWKAYTSEQENGAVVSTSTLPIFAKHAGKDDDLEGDRGQHSAAAKKRRFSSQPSTIHSTVERSFGLPAKTHRKVAEVSVSIPCQVFANVFKLINQHSLTHH